MAHLSRLMAGLISEMTFSGKWLHNEHRVTYRHLLNGCHVIHWKPAIHGDVLRTSIPWATSNAHLRVRSTSAYNFLWIFSSRNPQTDLSRNAGFKKSVKSHFSASFFKTAKYCATDSPLCWLHLWNYSAIMRGLEIKWPFIVLNNVAHLVSNGFVNANKFHNNG